MNTVCASVNSLPEGRGVFNDTNLTDKLYCVYRHKAPQTVTRVLMDERDWTPPIFYTYAQPPTDRADALSAHTHSCALRTTTK